MASASERVPRYPASSRAMINFHVEDQWYEALFEQDCLRVMNLLDEYPSLLREGWTGEPSNVVEGPPQMRSRSVVQRCEGGWIQRRWFKGRTALHVGAMRGCPDLVRQVLDLCDVKHEGGSLGKKRKGIRKTREKGVGTTEGLEITPPEREGGQKGKEPAHSSLQEVGNGQEVPILPEAPTQTGKIDVAVDKKLEGALSAAQSKREVDDRRLELTVAHWRSQIDDRDERARRTLAHWKRKLTKVNERNLEKSGGVSVNLTKLLLAQDGEYELDALAMAVLNGNVDVIILLMIGSRYCESNPYEVRSRLTAFSKEDDSEHRARLKIITTEVIESFSNDPIFCTTCLEAYSRHRDFNFLSRKVYLFHFLFMACFDEVLDETGHHILYSSNQVQKVLRKVLDLLWGKVGLFSSSLWRFLLELHDGQGRTPLHVAVDEGTVWIFRRTIYHVGEFDEEAISCAMTASDGAGRTALHRAVLRGGSSDTTVLLRDMMRTDEAAWNSLNAPSDHPILDILQLRSNYTFSLESLSNQFKFKGSKRFFEGETAYLLRSTPLQSAIIHRRTKILRCLLDEVEDIEKRVLPRPLPLPCRVRVVDNDVLVHLDPLQLAALVGEASVVKVLVESGIRVLLPQPNSDKSTKEKSSTKEIWRNWSGLHLAAASGNYEILKLFLDHRLYDPFVEDLDENTALHHAMKGKDVEFETNFLDYVDHKQILSSQERDSQFSLHSTARQCLTSEDFLVERQGCINLLLQAGCDIFKSNKKNQVPYPGPGLSLNAKFLSWWYSKQAKEFAAVQNTLNVAANAISVTAALVATASYVGPLQPPLGLSSGNPSQLQVGNLWVRIFIVCDTLSFYLAIAAIIFSLIPSLPMPQQSMIDELRRTLKMVTLAVAILFPSIIFVLVAFAASSIAVISADVGASNGGFLTISTAATGGFVCVVAIFLFFIRLLGFVFKRSPCIRNIYNATSF